MNESDVAYVNERLIALQGYWKSLQPLVQEVARMQPCSNGTLMDVGPYEGVISLKTAEELRASDVILVDTENSLWVKLPPRVRFETADVCQDGFLERFSQK